MLIVIILIKPNLPKDKKKEGSYLCRLKNVSRFL